MRGQENAHVYDNLQAVFIWSEAAFLCLEFYSEMIELLDFVMLLNSMVQCIHIIL